MTDVVIFDVGGQRFSTTLQTLQRYPKSFLPAMCTDCHDAVGIGKEIHIDRSPAGFGWVLEIYRGCATKISQSIPSDWGLTDMEDELNFYQLPAPNQLLPPFHGESLLRQEKKALKTLGDEMLAAMSAEEGSIYLEDNVGFGVCLDKDKSRENALKAIFLGQVTNLLDVVTVLHKTRFHWTLPISSIGNGRWKYCGVSFITLSDNQLGILNEHVRKFGFSISQSCGTLPDGKYGTLHTYGMIPLLKVGWRDQ
ncbi:hypothetical protein BSKO_06343 [Bryopsis sp. KO-2023]|nr:hypothetical protein BSKO_06343 [Bryopsis sp. KO-2023]